MGKGRLEAFSDGVIAIIITIMVLELKVPHSAALSDLTPLWPVFLSYVLSFVYIGIYWSNHHHLLHAAHQVSGGILWANLHLLFWLSVVPFTTAWMGENHFAQGPAVLYGVNLLMCAIAYTILVRALIHRHGHESVVARAIGGDAKGNISLLCYVLGMGGAFLNRWIAFGFYVAVAIMWLVPDRRIEHALAHPADHSG
jgi:uncharacterized membrane protein